jgi:hypothetical protein
LREKSGERKIMGIRGEIFSKKVILENRSYFFNVKENRMGDLYLNIVESKNRETGGFERQSVILFADDLQEFLRGFDESLRVMEKVVREKRRNRGAPAKAAADTPLRSAGGKRLVVKKGGRPADKGPGRGTPDRGPSAGSSGRAVIRRPRKKV